MDIDFTELKRVIDADRELKEREKAELLAALDDHDFLKRTAFGGAGAATGLLVAKYLKLSAVTQVLLSMAGFGVGRILYDLIKPQTHDSFGKQNRHQYEIKS